MEGAKSLPTQFKQLLEFKAQFGHCLAPVKYSANPNLGKWVTTNEEGKLSPSHLTEERLGALQNIGFEGATDNVPMFQHIYP